MVNPNNNNNTHILNFNNFYSTNQSEIESDEEDNILISFDDDKKQSSDVIAKSIDEDDNFFISFDNVIEKEDNSHLSEVNQSLNRIKDVIGQIKNVNEGEFFYLFDGKIETFKPYSGTIAKIGRYLGDYSFKTTFGKKLKENYIDTNVEEANRHMGSAINMMDNLSKAVQDTANKVNLFLTESNNSEDRAEVYANIFEILGSFENCYCKFEGQIQLIEVRDPELKKEYCTKFEKFKETIDKCVQEIKKAYISKFESFPISSGSKQNSNISQKEINNANLQNNDNEINIPNPLIPPVPPPAPPAPAIGVNKDNNLDPKEKYEKREKQRLKERQAKRLAPDRFYSFQGVDFDKQVLLKQIISNAQKMGNIEMEKEYKEKLKGEKTVIHFKSDQFKNLVREFTTDELQLVINLEKNKAFTDEEKQNHKRITSLLEQNQQKWNDLFVIQGGIMFGFEDILKKRLDQTEESPTYKITPYELRSQPKPVNVKINTHSDLIDELSRKQKNRKNPVNIEELIKKESNNDNLPNWKKNLKKVQRDDSEEDCIVNAKLNFGLKPVVKSKEEIESEERNKAMKARCTFAEAEKSSALKSLLKLKGNHGIAKESCAAFIPLYENLKMDIEREIADESNALNPNMKWINKKKDDLVKLEGIYERFMLAQNYIHDTDGDNQEFLKKFEDAKKNS